ncbi:MAG: PAS domain S-box protein, partial [Planctomycetaceae bacterium]
SYGRAVDYVTLEVNAAFESLLNAPRATVIGKKASEILPPAELKRWLGIFGPVALTGQSARYEIDSPANGKHFAGVAYCPEKGLFAVTFADVTEQKQSEQALRESESRYRLISENTDDVIWTLDIASRRFTYISPSVAKLCGYTAEEMLSKTLSEMLTPESYAFIVCTLPVRIDAYVAGDPDAKVWTNLIDHVRKDGAIIHAEVVSTIVADANGQPVHFIGITRDVTGRIKIYEDLQESQEKYHALVNGLPDIIMRFDREGRHLFASDNLRNIIDIPADDFIGKTHRELGFSEQKCRFWEECIRNVFDSRTPFEKEFSFSNNHGDFVFNWRLVPEFDTAGNIRSVLSIGRDITAHRRIEQQYQMLFQEMIDGFALHEIILDAKGIPKDYRFLAVNQAFERLTRLQAANIIGKTVLEVMPGTEQQWIDIYGQVAMTGQPAAFVNYSAELDRYFEVKAFRPAPNQFACIFVDITERKRAAEALQESQERMELSTNATGIGIFDWDIATNTVTWSRQHEIIFGYEPSPAGTSKRTYRQWAERIHPDDLAQVQSSIKQAIANHEPYISEYRIVWPDGTVHWISGRGRCYYDAQSNPTKMFGVVQDITERKQAEQSLRESEEKFHKAFR